ncbi:hypothetical protein C0J52_08741 [Blattella germanica]|nr:hypothetical protein C0J52_08741 [Blattella germanica]
MFGPKNDGVQLSRRLGYNQSPPQKLITGERITSAHVSTMSSGDIHSFSQSKSKTVKNESSDVVATKNSVTAPIADVRDNSQPSVSGCESNISDLGDLNSGSSRTVLPYYPLNTTLILENSHFKMELHYMLSEDNI